MLRDVVAMVAAMDTHQLRSVAMVVVTAAATAVAVAEPTTVAVTSVRAMQQRCGAIIALKAVPITADCLVA